MRLTTIGSFTLAILLLAVPLVLTGCGGGGGDDSTGGSTVSGYVRDAGSLTAIEGARVTTSGRTAVTNAQGFFTLTGVSTGALALTATASGYAAGSAQVPAGSGDRLLGSAILLTPSALPDTANITGRVTLGGQGAADATVRAGGVSAVTDTNGYYTLYNVPLGSQIVFASGLDANGNTVTGSASVNLTGATVEVNIQLTDQPPLPPTI